MGSALERQIPPPSNAAPAYYIVFGLNSLGTAGPDRLKHGGACAPAIHIFVSARFEGVMKAWTPDTPARTRRLPFSRLYNSVQLHSSGLRFLIPLPDQPKSRRQAAASSGGATRP